MSKYKLLPVQVERLQKQYDESLVKLAKLNVIKTDELVEQKVATGTEINFGVDTSLLGNLSVVTRDYKDAKEKLENYEVIMPNNSDVIGIGSTFELAMDFNGIEEKDIYTLVEVRNVGDDHSLISVVSPLGEAVMGAKAGDEISYMVNKRKITGKVTDIIKEHEKTL